MMNDPPDPNAAPHPFPPMGRFEPHLIAPPQILGCERTPFLVLVGLVAFLILVVFGITLFGIAGGLLIFLGGVRWLRAMFEVDPRYFAMRQLAMRTPRHLLAELPPAYMKDWAFVGYEDPPTLEEMFVAWSRMLGSAAIPALLAALMSSLVVGCLVFAGILTLILIGVFGDVLHTRLLRSAARHGMHRKRMYRETAESRESMGSSQEDHRTPFRQSQGATNDPAHTP